MDYGIMNALTEALKGTSESRRNRRQEVANMRQEMLNQERRDLANASNIAEEHKILAENRQKALTKVWEIPHMKEYVNNIYDDKKAQLREMIKASGGNYSKAVTSGKILDFRDNIMSTFENDDKYQKAIKSAEQMALYKGYLSKPETSGLISNIDRLKHEEFLKGNIESFSMSGFRSEYDAVDPSKYYQGESINFDKIFNEQADKFYKNYALENNDHDYSKLEAIARAEYPEMELGTAKNMIVKAWGQKDMGFDSTQEGTKELDSVKIQSMTRRMMNTPLTNPKKAESDRMRIAESPIMQALGVSYEGPKQYGDTKIGGVQVFKSVNDSVIKVVTKNNGDIRTNGDGTYDINNVTGMFDTNGVQIKASDGDDIHNDMRFGGLFIAHKAIIQLPGGGIKSMLLTSSDDRDTRASLEAEYGSKAIKYSPTYIAEFNNDGLRFHDKQVFQEVNPNSISIDRIMKDSDITEEFMEAQKSDRALEKISSSQEAKAKKHYEGVRNSQMKTGNKIYADITGDENVTMDVVNDWVNPRFKSLVDSGVPEDKKGVLYAIATGYAKSTGGDAKKSMQSVMRAVEDKMKGTSKEAKGLQKVLLNGSNNDVIDYMERMFSEDFGDAKVISTLADSWNIYKS